MLFSDINVRYFGRIGLIGIDQGGINVQHKGDWHRGLAWTHSGLGNMKRDRTICMTSKGAVPLGVLIHFERSTGSLQLLVCQQLSQHHLHLVFKEANILYCDTIALLIDNNETADNNQTVIKGNNNVITEVIILNNRSNNR